VPKRFTDTDKWMGSWFYELSPIQKLIWLYALDSCDHTGVWRVNTPMMSGMIGAPVTIADIEDSLSARIVRIEDGKYFIPKFLQFQYPKGLKKSVNAQRSVVESLIRLGLHLTLHELLPKSYLSLIEGLPMSCPTPIDTDINTNINTNTDPLDIDDIRIGCFVGKDEAGAFVKLFKPFSRQQGLYAIRVLTERRKRNGDPPKPYLSDMSPYIKEHFHQIKEQDKPTNP